MATSATTVLREQGRGVTGALLIAGLAVLHTMETWWLGWELPLVHLLVYAVVGLGVVFAITHVVGFREDDGASASFRSVVVDFSELVVQSLAAALVVLFAFGVITVDSAPLTVVRLLLVQVVPLGFGAALANALLQDADGAAGSKPFPTTLGTFALGAVFVTIPLAPTQEIVVIAQRTGWPRLAGLMVLSVLGVHLVLHELEFRGHARRVRGRSTPYQVGTAFVVYAVALLVSVALLAAFQQFSGTPPRAALQLVVVHAFPASIGASGGEVVL